MKRLNSYFFSVLYTFTCFYAFGSTLDFLKPVTSTPYLQSDFLLKLIFIKKN